MNKINELMESEEMKSFTEDNQEVIAETAKAVEDFTEVVKEYIIKNPDVFMDSKIENIEKNIRIFTEAAVCQFITEAVSVNSEKTKIVEPVTEENALDEYI